MRATRRGESLFRKLVEMVSDWAWEVDENGVYTYSSPRSRDLIGYEPEEVVGKTPFDFMRPDEAERVLAEFAFISEKREPIVLLDNTLVRKDGTLVAVETSGTPIFDKDGVFRGYRGFDRDVTARKGAEDALRRNEQFLQAVFDGIQDGISVSDKNLTVLRVNRAMEQWYAYSMPIRGRKCYEVYRGGRKKPCEVCPSIRAMEQKTLQMDLAPLYGPDGSTVGWLELYAFPMLDEKGEVWGVIEHVRDVTERERAEAALRESEERYRRLVDLSPDGIMVTVRGTAVFVNAAALAMYGASRLEDIVGKPTLDTITPEYREIARARMMSMIEGRAQSVPPLEEKFLRLDGSEFDVEVAASRITYQGEPAILAVIRDITKRKRAEEAVRESEERYRNLIETTETGYLIVDGQGRVLDANAEYVRLTGRQSLEEILGRSVLEWTAEYDLERNAEEVRKCAETGVVRNLVIDYVWPDGAIVPIEINATVIETREGPRILTLCRDITDRRRAEEDQRGFERQVEDQKRQFYRETILSVTEGKLAISEPSDVANYTAGAELSLEVLDASQVSPARRLVEQFCAEKGLSGEPLDLFTLGVGEAVTNAVKHGRHARVRAGEKDGALWAAISDQGSGIESLILPSAVLRRGYSTKPSLGLGYTIMLEVADSILLKTDREGTTVVLVKNLEAPVLELTLGQLPDTWKSIPA